MAEKEQVIKEKVEHSGYFDFKGFYSFAHSWLKEENYDVEEEKYSETVSANSKSINFEWKATKTLSDYFKNEIKMRFEVRDLTDVEVEIEGKKKKMNKGKISLEIKGNLIRDPQSKWDITPWYRLLRDAYNKYIIASRVESAKDKVSADVIKFKEELKSYLELSGRR